MRYNLNAIPFLCFVFVLCCMFCSACFWHPNTDSRIPEDVYDSISMSVDTVAFLEPEIPSFSDILLANLSEELVKKDSAAVVFLLESTCNKFDRPVSPDSLDEYRKYLNDILLYLDSSRYDFVTLHIDIESFKKKMANLFP